MSSITDTLTNKDAKSAVAQVESIFNAVPNFLPAFITSFIVSILPWVTVTIGVFTLFSVLALVPAILGIEQYVTQMAIKMGETHSPVSYSIPYLVISTALLSLSGYLDIIAFSPLRKRSLTGWYLLFWANVVSIVYMLIDTLMMQSSLLSTALTTGIAVYVLFKIKPQYT